MKTISEGNHWNGRILPLLFSAEITLSNTEQGPSCSHCTSVHQCKWHDS